MSKLLEPFLKLTTNMRKLNPKAVWNKARGLADKEQGARQDLGDIARIKTLSPEHEAKWHEAIEVVHTAVEELNTEVLPNMELSEYHRKKLTKMSSEQAQDADEESNDMKALGKAVSTIMGVVGRGRSRVARGLSRATELGEVAKGVEKATPAKRLRTKQAAPETEAPAEREEGGNCSASASYAGNRRRVQVEQGSPWACAFWTLAWTPLVLVAPGWPC